MEQELTRDKTETTHLYAAVRTLNRRELISPTAEYPDFFSLEVPSGEPISIQSRIHGHLRNHANMVVNDDHDLLAHEAHPEVRGYAVYRSSTVRSETPKEFSTFDETDVYSAVLDFEQWSENANDYTEEERRVFRVKAHLMQQVGNLMRYRQLVSPAERHS